MLLNQLLMRTLKLIWAYSIYTYYQVIIDTVAWTTSYADYSETVKRWAQPTYPQDPTISWEVLLDKVINSKTYPDTSNIDYEITYTFWLPTKRLNLTVEYTDWTSCSEWFWTDDQDNPISYIDMPDDYKWIIKVYSDNDYDVLYTQDSNFNVDTLFKDRRLTPLSPWVEFRYLKYTTYDGTDLIVDHNNNVPVYDTWNPLHNWDKLAMVFSYDSTPIFVHNPISNDISQAIYENVTKIGGWTYSTYPSYLLNWSNWYYYYMAPKDAVSRRPIDIEVFCIEINSDWSFNNYTTIHAGWSTQMSLLNQYFESSSPSYNDLSTFLWVQLANDQEVWEFIYNNIYP